MTCPGLESPLKAGYRMSSNIMTSWKSLISVHISLENNNEDERLLSAFLCQQAQCCAFLMNHLIQSPYRRSMLETNIIPILAAGKTEA